MRNRRTKKLKNNKTKKLKNKKAKKLTRLNKIKNVNKIQKKFNVQLLKMNVQKKSNGQQMKIQKMLKGCKKSLMNYSKITLIMSNKLKLRTIFPKVRENIRNK